MTHEQPHPEPRRPHQVIAQRVREVRSARGLTAAQLGEKMTEAGLRWDRNVVASFENGRRAAVSVEELLALAAVLEVAPVHLIVPLDDDGWIYLTPEAAARNGYARAWIRGNRALPGTDARKFYSEVPEAEWRQQAEQQEEILRQLAEDGIVSRAKVSQATNEVKKWDPAAGDW